MQELNIPLGTRPKSPEDWNNFIKYIETNKLEVKKTCDLYNTDRRRFYYWRAKLNPNFKGTKSNFKAIKISKTHSQTEDNRDSNIKLQTTTGIKLVIPQNISEANLLKVLSCIKESEL